MGGLGNKQVMAKNIQKRMDERGIDRNELCRVNLQAVKPLALAMGSVNETVQSRPARPSQQGTGMRNKKAPEPIKAPG